MENDAEKLRPFHLSKKMKPVEIDALLADIEIRQEPLLLKQKRHDLAVAMPYALYLHLVEQAKKRDERAPAE